jgi:flagellar FliL protein
VTELLAEFVDDEDDRDEDAMGDDGDEGAGDDADGDDGEGLDGDEAGAGKQKDIKKLALFIGVPIILLIVAGAGLYFTGMLDGLLGKGATTEEHAEAGDGHGGGHEDGEDHGDGHGAEAAFLQIPNLVVNLRSDDGQPRYLRLSIQLELSSEDDVNAIEALMPRVVDQFQTYLRELRVKDLRGSAGIYRLQIELLSRVNAAAYPIKVKDVLFQEILIQ